MIIDRMCIQDTNQVFEIEKQIFSTPWSQESFIKAINDNDNVYFTAKENDKVIGYVGIWMVAGEGQVNNVAVTPDKRGHGVCQKLMKSAMDVCRQNGVGAFTLEVRAGNAPAIHIYEKIGFKNCGVRKNYYDKPKEDAVIMWLGQNPNQ